MKPRRVLTPSWASLIASLPALPAAHETSGHAVPFVHNTPTSKALHFAIEETQSRMQTRDPDALELEYTRTMMGFLLFTPQPRCIGMIGLGGGSLAKFCYRHLPRTRIHVVEINPHVIALRDEFLVPADDDRFTVEQGDGAHWVRSRTLRPDVLVVDGFDTRGLPAALSSARFYDDCVALLPTGGLLVANLHCADAGYEDRLADVRRSFGGCTLRVEDSERSNCIVFARKGRPFGHPSPGALSLLPRHLDGAAAQQLLGACARVVNALESDRR
jgi:spermidine synthase